MFSIAAINGGGSTPPRLDALQPTKEAQEACLAQTYQEALADLQGGNLEKARGLLESILQDPIILQAATAASKTSTGLNPMLQLRFSTLKNLAETLYKQDIKHHGDALGYYLQAASIDRGDSVLWNRLGTLACALGHLNIARIAFEQGLVCSPRNWLCMEKLAEVLIAIGDEEACRHIVKRLLKISPFHPRATYIEAVLEGRGVDAGEILNKRGKKFHGYFVKLGTLPRGLDLLEPHHFSLSFPMKRNVDNEVEDEGSLKRRKVQPEEVCLPDFSWGSILISVLDYLQVNVGQGGASAWSSFPQDDGSSVGKLIPRPVHVPLVNSLIAVVPDSRSGIGNETAAAAVRGSEELSAQKIEKQQSYAAEPRVVSVEKAVSNSPTKVGQPVSLDIASESLRDGPPVSLDTASEPLAVSEGERFADNRRTEDMRTSAHLNHTSKQIKRAPSGHLKGAVFTDEGVLLYPQRRITRLERIRTQRHDKDGELFEDKEINKDHIERFRQLLEPFVCTVAPDAGTSQLGGVGSGQSNNVGQNAGGAGDAAGTFEDIAVQEETILDEERKVQQFLEDLKVNSGPYHVGHELLENLAATHCKRSLPISTLLMLENMTREFSRKTRSRRCSLFLAELCLEMFLSSSCADNSTSSYLRDSGFHLAMVLEHAASHAHFREQDRTPSLRKSSRSERQSRDSSKKRELASSKTLNSGQPGFDSVAKTAKGQHKVEIVNGGKDNDWPLWVRFHWLKGQWQMFSGRQEDAYQELTLCLAILDSRAQQDENSAQILFPNSDVEMVLTPAKVQRKLYELHIDKLLKREASKLEDEAHCSDLIDLLLHVLLPDNETDRAKLGYDETKRGVVDSSPEYVGLSMLISACEKVNPPNLWLAMQCHARKLGFLCSAVDDINTTGIAFSLESIRLDRCSSAGEPEHEQGKGNYIESRLITEQVKEISSCAASIREQLGDSGCLVTSSVQASLLRQLQHLLLDSMCDYIKSQNDERPVPVAASSLNVELDCGFFVDACVAFCRLQHLDANATLKQQVSLLGTVHELLAIRGLCCAGKGCYGGEGAFLKLAIKHLGTVELRLRLTCGQQEGLKLAEGGADEVLEMEKEDENESSSEKQEDNQQGHVKTAKEELEEEIERYRLELGLDSVMDQCFFCLYGLNLRGGFEISTQTDGLTEHKNTNRGDYETQEQCAGVYQYILPYAKACSRPRLMKLRKVLRAVYKQFPSPPPDVLADKSVDHFLDGPELDEEKLHGMVVSGKDPSDIIEFAMELHSLRLSSAEEQTSKQVDMVNDSQSQEGMSDTLPGNGHSRDSHTNLEKNVTGLSSEKSGGECNPAAVSSLTVDHVEPYLDVYEDLYHLVSEVEDITASDKWAGFVLTKEGEEFVEQNAKLLKYDLCFNPMRFDSWYKLAKIYDEEVDLMLNDGSKNINAADWRQNKDLTERVEISRRRARRCLLMTLALSNTPEKQSEIHELLALVYYDCLQNVAPSFDQRSHVPVRSASWISLCQKALNHFEGAFIHRPDWTHLLYMGKLCEKLCRPSEEAFDFYRRAVEMKSSAVDPVYRLHASRLKLLCKTDEQNVKTLQVIGQHCYLSSSREKVRSLLECVMESSPKTHSSPMTTELANNNIDLILQIRRQLFDDCITAMKVCVEGELKHYHKARFRLAHCLCSPTEIQDMDRAKEELAFCFRSSRSLFTINMWEIDGSLRKIRRKAAHPTNLDVQMPESSRKFITCVRKYLVLYLSLCEKTGDIYTLERAFSSLKTDKKFSLCLDDLSRVALGKYIQALVMAICQADASESISLPTLYSLLEKFFNLFMEFGISWPESLETSLAEAEVPSTTEFLEGSIYGYIHRYLDLLENDLKLDTMEAINEKIRKRFRSLKPLASPTAQVCQHSCLAWGRALCYALASITPLPDRRLSPQSEAADQTAGLIVDLQEDVLIASSYQVTDLQRETCAPPTEQKLRTDIKRDLSSIISAIKAVPVKRASPDNLERATALLRSTYVFCRDSLSGPFPDGINLFLVAVSLGDGSSNGVQNSELDISIPRKLLLWAFTLVHGRTGTVAEAVKYCEEQAKPRKKSVAVGGSLHSSSAGIVNNARE